MNPAPPVIASLDQRFVAWLLDRIVPFVLSVGFGLVGWYAPAKARLIFDVVIVVLFVAWVMGQWWAYGTRGAGLGYKVMGLKLVRLRDGKPLGWGRMFLRTLILQVACLLVIPGIILAIMLTIHERRQGWMDLAVGSVTVREIKREVVPPDVVSRPNIGHSVVGLPAHLAQPGYIAPDQNFVAPLPAQQPQFQQPAPTPPAAPISAVPGFGQSTSSALTGSGPGAARSNGVSPVSNGNEDLNFVSGPNLGGATFGAVQQVQAPENAIPESQPGAQPGVMGPGEISRNGPAPRLRPRPYVEEAEEGTRLVAALRDESQGWWLRFDDGRQVQLTGTILLGRDPAARPEDGEVELIQAGEPSQTVSKTHLGIGVDRKGAFLIDRGSTNGTAVRVVTGELKPCPPHERVRLLPGQIVSFGDRNLQVLRRTE